MDGGLPRVGGRKMETGGGGGGGGYVQWKLLGGSLRRAFGGLNVGTFHQSRRARRAGRGRLAVVEGLEGRRLLSVTIFGGRWTGTYQLDAQSTANAADPHYTGSGTIVVDLTNGVGSVSLS